MPQRITLRLNQTNSSIQHNLPLFTVITGHKKIEVSNFQILKLAKSELWAPKWLKGSGKLFNPMLKHSIHSNGGKNVKQAGAELGQAQFKLVVVDEGLAKA